MSFIVVLEGLPGSGKTTTARALKRRLEGEGLSVDIIDIDTISYAEPLRKVADKMPIGHKARLLIFWALRIFQNETIQRAGRKCDVVIVDRAWGTTLAFDKYGNMVPDSVLEWIEASITARPNITIFFDVPYRVARSRKDSITLRNAIFARRVICGYKTLAMQRRWVRIDATKNFNEVVRNCLEIVSRALEASRKRSLS